MVSSLTSDTNVSWSIDSENNKDDVVGDVASTPRAVLFGGEVARPSEGSAILSSEHQSSRYHHRASELARPSSREESVVRPVAADGGIKETSGGILAGGALRGANEKKRQTEWKERDRNETESASDIVEWKKNGGRSNSITSKPSSSMSLELQNHQVNTSSPQDSGHYSNGPERAAGGDVGVEEVAVPSSCTVKVTGGNDEEESYEAFGSVEGDHDDGLDSPGGGSSSAPSPTGPNSNRNPRSPNSTIGRHSWLRTSLRRTPPCSGRKRLSTSALASQLYRSGSFNSSGRGSNCDTADDMTMYSDVSLEEDVMDLNHKATRQKKDAHQNCPTELLRCTGVITAGPNRPCSFPSDSLEDNGVLAALSSRITKTEGVSREIEAKETSSHKGIIEIARPTRKVNVATGNSNVNAAKIE